MNTPLLQTHTTAEEVFQYLPQAARIFIAFQATDCPGCCLARFCTLEELARIYGFDLVSFLGVLQRELLQPTMIRRSKP